MKLRLLGLWERIQTSYWFIPSLMVVAATLLAFGTTTFDSYLGAQWLEKVPWLQANQPDGARALLSTVAASMMGVAGVTFSITMVAMVMASSQFGPRLLSNFMRDRGNQTTLGIFIATFIYCLLVLRTVQSPGIAADSGAEAASFVPHLAVLVGLLLALVSLGAFIFFIHHAPDSIHISNVIADVGRSFSHKVDDIYPERDEGDEDSTFRSAEAEVESLRDGRFHDDAASIEADGSGYIQLMEVDTLVDVAAEFDLFLRVNYRPGNFVSPGVALVSAAPAERVEDAVHRRIRRAFVWGRKRSRTMDPLFLSDQLVEIAARALSPGVNDPHSAMDCLDWLGAGLIRLGRRGDPRALRLDDQGHPRVLARGVGFDVAMDEVFDQLRPYVSPDRNAATHAFRVLGELALASLPGTRPNRIELHTDALLEAVHLNQSDPRALARAERMHGTVRELLNGTADPDERTAELRWLGGSA